MTTLAYRNGVMAADSKCSAAETNYSSATKIHKLPDGSLVGFCGRSTACERMLDVMKQASVSGGLSHDLFQDCKGAQGLYVEATSGKVYFLQGGKHSGYCELEGEVFADGSGFIVALAAMKAGATAEKAVEIACELDNNSGGPVVTLTLGNKKKR
jgi:ATP-dependent protease HslVU (ClpYQ) peptidase subunit